MASPVTRRLINHTGFSYLTSYFMPSYVSSEAGDWK
jgi:hypothetical protein